MFQKMTQGYWSDEFKEFLNKVEGGLVTEIQIFGSILNNNSIVRNGQLAALTKALQRNISIKKISVPTSLENSDETAIAIALSLDKNITIQEIAMYGPSNGMLTDKGAIALGFCLEKNSTVKIINLNNNEIGTKGFKAFAQALKKNTTLRTLI